MNPYPEVNEQLRREVVLERLRLEPSAVALYVKGLCCPSCAIGVRIKISKLGFVDRERFSKGVDLDAKHQITTVAINSGESSDTAALKQAVHNAGYEAILLYTLKNDTLYAEQLTAED